MLKRHKPVSETTNMDALAQASLPLEEPDPQRVDFEGDRGSWLSVDCCLDGQWHVGR